MKFCEKCRVKVTDDSIHCPLCQRVLSDNGDNPDTGGDSAVFPIIPTFYSKYHLFIKLIILASITVCVVSIIIDLLIPTKMHWSVFVVTGVACVWLSLGIAYRKMHNIPKVILHQVIAAAVVVLLWDYATGWRNWSVDYVIPFLFVGANISLITVAILMRLDISDFIFYCFINMIFGIVPIIFIYTKILTVLYPSLISVGLNIIALSGLFLFQGRRIRGEIMSRFHL